MAGINDVFKKSSSYSWLKGEGNIARQYGLGSKQGLAKQIFHTMMKKVIEDVVEEGNVFKLPLYGGVIMVEELPEEVTEKQRKRGKMNYFSEFFAQGKMYDIIYRFKDSNKKCKKYKLIASTNVFKRLVYHVNTGRRYFGYVNQW
jgi:hypothetical protein